MIPAILLLKVSGAPSTFTIAHNLTFGSVIDISKNVCQFLCISALYDYTFDDIRFFLHINCFLVKKR